MAKEYGRNCGRTLRYEIDKDAQNNGYERVILTVRWRRVRERERR
jgi:hypothetical protein